MLGAQLGRCQVPILVPTPPGSGAFHSDDVPGEKEYPSENAHIKPHPT